MSTPTIAIVGAGLAGAKTATAAREHGFDGRVVLIGDEPGLPYERPPFSKDVLRGDAGPETADVYDEAHYEDHDIERLVERTVIEIETGSNSPSVILDDGGRIDATAIVLATGSAARRIPIDGIDLDGVHHLRTRADSLALRDGLEAASKVAVVGAGWIGSEVAASARQMGVDVVLIDPLSTPLERVLGTTIGGVFRDLHADQGVDLRLGSGIDAIVGDDNVRAVRLDDGSTVDVDLVVMGVGAVPRTDLAERAGLVVDGGVVVDQHLRSSVSDIYAAGDIASAWHPHYQRHVRVEHWANALNQGTTAGINAAGGDETYDRLPYFFSDQYDLGMEYLGLPGDDDELVVRGDLDGRAFLAFWHANGVVNATMNVNIWDVTDDLRALIQSGTAVDPAALADDDTPIDRLLEGNSTT